LRRTKSFGISPRAVAVHYNRSDMPSGVVINIEGLIGKRVIDPELRLNQSTRFVVETLLPGDSSIRVVMAALSSLPSVVKAAELKCRRGCQSSLDKSHSGAKAWRTQHLTTLNRSKLRVVNCKPFGPAGLQTTGKGFVRAMSGDVRAR
jgi:hypothetical protein